LLSKYNISSVQITMHDIKHCL